MRRARGHQPGELKARTHAECGAHVGKYVGTNPENWERARTRFKPMRTTGLITCYQPKREDGARAKEKKESGAHAKCCAYARCIVNTGTKENKESGAHAKHCAHARCIVNTGTKENGESGAHAKCCAYARCKT